MKPFVRPSAIAEYNPGTIDGSRPGIFYVPIRDVKTYNTHQDEDLFLHEAIPGHHFQISLQQENTALPSHFEKTYGTVLMARGGRYTPSLWERIGTV